MCVLCVLCVCVLCVCFVCVCVCCVCACVCVHGGDGEGESLMEGVSAVQAVNWRV